MDDIQEALETMDEVRLRDLLASDKVYAAFADASSGRNYDNLLRHEFMLADAVRMRVYREAIQREVRPNDRVIDIGGGTGILSFFAAQRTRETVYLLEQSRIIETARKLALVNGFETIHFFNGHSRGFTCEEPVDLIIHEQMGNALIDENMIDAVCDVRDRLLKPEGRILPARFDLFIEPIRFQPDYRIPRLHDIRFEGIDFSCLRRERTSRGSFVALDESRVFSPSRLDIAGFLAEPRPVWSFDLHDLERLETPTRLEFTTTVSVERGQLDAVCFYFRADFGHGLEILTAPDAPYTHWLPYICLLDGEEVVQGQRLLFKLLLPPRIARVDRWKLYHEVLPPA